MDATATPDDPVLLSYSQVAKLLQVSARSVWSLVNRSGDLPAIRVGSSVRIDKRDVLTFINSQRESG
jgi:excisionase family DNA binding protein